jgi:predicted outer membrane repeat protein
LANFDVRLNTAGGNGGGVWLSSSFSLSSFFLSDIRISNNSAVGRGGGLFFTGAPLQFQSRRLGIVGNSAAVGGGFSFQPSTAVVDFFMDGSSIVSNSAQTWGGAANILATDAFRINNSIVDKNVASYGGGAFFLPSWATSGITPSAIVTYSTLTNNIASGSVSGASGGGAIWSAVDLDVRRSTFTGNIALPYGGSILATSGKLNCFESYFINNLAVSSDSVGGAVFTDVNADSSINGCVFKGNIANKAGGGVFSQSKSASLSDCAFSDNVAARGAAIAASTGSLSIQGGVFKANIASEYGGAVAISGPTVVSGTTFQNNTGGEGGALYCSPEDFSTASSSVDIADSAFEANSAVSDAGAISGPCPVSVARSSFTRNVAGGNGGAVNAVPSLPLGNVYLATSRYSGNKAGGFGGAIYSAPTDSILSVTVDTSIAVGNDALVGSGMYASSGTLFLQGATASANSHDEDLVVGPAALVVSPTSLISAIAPSSIDGVHLAGGSIQADTTILSTRLYLDSGVVLSGASPVIASAAIYFGSASIRGTVICGNNCLASVPLNSSVSVTGASGSLVNRGTLVVGPSGSQTGSNPCLTLQQGGSIVNFGTLSVSSSCGLSANGTIGSFIENRGNFSLGVSPVTIKGVSVNLVSNASILDVGAISNATYGALSVDGASVSVGGTLRFYAIEPFFANSSSFNIITISNGGGSNAVSGQFDMTQITTRAEPTGATPTVSYGATVVTVAVPENPAIVIPPNYGLIFGLIFGLLGAAAVIALIGILVWKHLKKGGK